MTQYPSLLTISYNMIDFRADYIKLIAASPILSATKV